MNYTYLDQVRVIIWLRYVFYTYLSQVRVIRSRIYSRYVLFTRTSQVREKVKKSKKSKSQKVTDFVFCEQGGTRVVPTPWGEVGNAGTTGT